MILDKTNKLEQRNNHTLLIKNMILDKTNKLEPRNNRKLNNSQSVLSVTTDDTYKLNKSDSNPTFNFHKKLKMLNERTKKFMNNWELDT